MRTKTVTRYYCDHCSKGGFRKPDMIQHEATCTKNPKRACWMCECNSGVRDFTALAKQMLDRDDVFYVSDNDDDKNGYETKSEKAISWLMSECDGCPACTLSVLRQGKIYAFTVFDYKKAVSEWHREKHALEVMFYQ